MPSPFETLQEAPEEFIAALADGMEKRAADPAMEPIIDHYMEHVDWTQVTAAADIGSGTGPIARRMAELAPDADICAIEPLDVLAGRGEALAQNLPNLSFIRRDGADTGLDDDSQDFVALHTVLSHATGPSELIAETVRILKPGGVVAICDVDFAKASISAGPNDPLQALISEFVAEFVSDAHIGAKLSRLAVAAGLQPVDFSAAPLVSNANSEMRVWIEWPGRRMVEDGRIGEPLLKALLAEYDRRAEAGVLFGLQMFATLVARRPA